MKKIHKNILIGTSIFILIMVTLLTSATFYLQWYALQAEGNPRGKDISGSFEYIKAHYPHIQTWLDSITYNHALKDTFILAKDNTKLHAYFLQADSCTTQSAVIIHGYTDNAIRMMHIGYMYHHDLQYNILLPDLRYSGLSEGTHIQMGWNDRKDVLQWIEVAHELFATDTTRCNMVVHGISMGGATTMCVSGEKTPDYVRCFINDCGYTSVWDEYAGELKEQFGLPTFPLLHLASWLTDIRFGWNFNEASPLQQIKQCEHPMLFIHGANDTFVPTWMSDTLYQHKNGIKEIWHVPGGNHADSYYKYPKEYTEIVKRFLEKYNIIKSP